ncbi:TIGR03773 family transporter-associated surface protein [Cellulomonas triticagri]|uniref:Bacterial Ig-like domain-containing protein n=1 Tax=Cellulomonas triticagri TaxID=2483352 RepID=A0A3M2JMG9_9CELL|nr:TIGR03773 family transporter-associated surface protein [Cellulomonas triticagri]RMI13010.1 hypothetical protein EBM89_06310 [Cellulomonas triticagri]
MTPRPRRRPAALAVVVGSLIPLLILPTAAAAAPVLTDAVVTRPVGPPEDPDPGAGEGPAQAVATTVTVPTASATSLRAGDPLTLSSTVAPAEVPGWVEFVHQSGSVGGAAVVDGEATLVTTALPIGEHLVTAELWPDDTEAFAPSTSAGVRVTVTPARDTAQLFVAGLQPQYDDGATITLTAAGDPLGEGESYRWVERPVGGDRWETVWDDAAGRLETGASLVRTATRHYNGHEYAVQVLKDRGVLAQSAPVAPVVVGESRGSGIDVRIDGVAASYPYATYTTLRAVGAALPDGARYEWFQHQPRWTDPDQPSDLGDPAGTDTKTLYVPEWGVLDIGVRVVGADGTVLGTSPLYTLVSQAPPVLAIEGLLAVYAPGDVIRATAVVDPADAPFDEYRWTLQQGRQSRVLDATGPVVEIPATTDLDRASLSVSLVEPTRRERQVGYASEQLVVSEPGAVPALFFGPIARHYHSGEALGIQVTSTVPLTEGMHYRWYLQRADQAEEHLVDGATGSRLDVVAEVALAGSQIRVELVDAQGAVVAALGPQGIAVDDHGNPPVRTLGLVAEQDPGAGDVVTFRAAASPATVVDRYEWWVTPAGATEPELREVTRTPQWSLRRVAADDGAQVHATLTLDTGATYIRSAAVAIDPVDPGDPDEPDDPGTPGPGAGWADLPLSGRSVLSVGHMDVLATVTADDLHVDIHDGSSAPARTHEVDDAAFYAAPGSFLASDRLAEVFGAGVSEAWVLPQTQNFSLVWPGWNVAPSGTPVTWTLDGVRGPGRFALFETGSFGDLRLLLSDTGSPDALTYTEHAHGSWAFTSEGVYCLDSTYSTGTGAARRAESATLLVAVGDVDPERVTEQMCGRTPEQIVDDVRPGVAPDPVDAAALTDAARGGVRAAGSTVTTGGGTVDVFVGTGQAGRWVSLWWYSTPRDLGWSRVASDGWVRGVPVGATTVGDHRLAVLDRDGELVGWAPVRVTVLEPPRDPVPSPGPAPAPVAQPASTEVCTPTPVQRQVAAGDAAVVAAGHLDVGAQLVGGDLVARIKDDHHVWRDPAGMVLHVSDTARGTVPAGYGFLGAPGSTIWTIPEAQAAGVPWLGWNTQHPSVTSGLTGGVTFSLTSVSGPGDVVVYMGGTLGGAGQRVFDTVGGPRSTTVPLNTHQHANWVFTRPGAYHLTLTQTGTTTAGQRVSATGVLHVFVGSGDPRSAAATTTVTEWVGRTASGAECALSPDQLAAVGGSGAGSTALTARSATQAAALAAVLAVPEPDPGRSGDDGAVRADGPVADPPVAQRGMTGVLVLGLLAGLALVAAAVTGRRWWRAQGPTRSGR